jgi:hypothetical protein
VYLNRALNQIQYHTTTSVLARAAFQKKCPDKQDLDM